MALIPATATLVISAATYIRPPSDRYFLTTLVIYLLSTVMIALLIYCTGEYKSPFTFLWILVSLFGPIFGLYGTITVIIMTAIFTINQYIVHNPLEASALFSIIAASAISLIAGLLIWREKTGRDEADNDNKAYKNLANELTEVANKSEIVINAIGDGVIAVDNQGVIQLINPAAQNIIGWSKRDALSLNYKSVLKLLDANDQELNPNSDPLQQVLNNNQQIRTNNLTLMTKSEKKIIVSLVVSPVGDIGSGAIAVFHDVTKERAEEREQAEFISTASHEMRTPVASIEGYLGLALNPQTAQIDVRARDFILKAHASAVHLGHLFQDLLDVSKADDGRISNNPKVVNIINFTHDILQGLNQKATEKGLQIIFKPIPDNTKEKIIAPEYSVNLDNDHIREILSNLVENAIKYTPQGEIIVDINGDEDHVVISVKDSGIGIPTEDLGHLFQKFYRVDNKNTREIGGTGLGLYLSRRLAEIMGGRIWVDSTYGHGSTFFLELPRISRQEAARLEIEQDTLVTASDLFSNDETNEPSTSEIEQIDQMPAPQPQIQLHPLPKQPVTNNVPRGQALTPEQIAAYVTKQRALAREQAAAKQPQDRPESMNISVPNR